MLFIFRSLKKDRFSIEELYKNIINTKIDNVYFKAYYYDQNKSFFKNIIEIKKIKADINHITGDIYYISPFLSNVVLTIHDVGHLKNLRGIKKQIYYWIWLKLPAYCSKKIITISNYTARDVTKYIGIPKRKLAVIFNPAPEGFIYMPKIFNKTNPRVLQIGTAPHKNLTLVISAIKDISCELVIIGSLNPADKENLKNYNIKFDQKEKIPYEQVREEYIKADVVMFISSHEGFGMPILEANAIGRPIITSRRTSIPEIAADAALYIDEFSEKNVRQAVENLIENDALRESLIQNGLRNIERFDKDLCIQNYISIYTEIVKNSLN